MRAKSHVSVFLLSSVLVLLILIGQSWQHVHAQSSGTRIVTLKPPGQVAAGQSFVVHIEVAYNLVQPGDAMWAGIMDKSDNPMPGTVKSGDCSSSGQLAFCTMIPPFPSSAIDSIDFKISCRELN